MRQKEFINVKTRGSVCSLGDAGAMMEEVRSSELEVKAGGEMLEERTNVGDAGARVRLSTTNLTRMIYDVSSYSLIRAFHYASSFSSMR